MILRIERFSLFCFVVKFRSCFCSNYTILTTLVKYGSELFIFLFTNIQSRAIKRVPFSANQRSRDSFFYSLSLKRCDGWNKYMKMAGNSVYLTVYF